MDHNLLIFHPRIRPGYRFTELRYWLFIDPRHHLHLTCVHCRSISNERISGVQGSVYPQPRTGIWHHSGLYSFGRIA